MGFLNSPGGAAAMSAGSDLLSMGAGAILTAEANRRQWKHQKELYSWQRRDALADWNMQNEYNHPSAQMARLRAAGLNPNLVYGNGADAVSNSPVRASSVSNPDIKVPDIPTGLGRNSLDAYYDVQVKDAMLKNFNLTGQNIEVDMAKKRADILAVLAGIPGIKSSNLKKAADAAVANATIQDSIEAKKLGNLKTKADTAYTIAENIRKGKLNTAQIRNLIADSAIKNAQLKNIFLSRTEMYKKITALGLDNQIKKLEIDAKKAGRSWGDNILQRRIDEMLQRLSGN